MSNQFAEQESTEESRAGPLCRRHKLWCGAGQVCLYIDGRNAVLLTCVRVLVTG